MLPAGLCFAALFSGCSGGGAADSQNRGAFRMSLISTGLGQVYPSRIPELDAFGQPTTRILDIVEMDDLKKNVRANNPVLAGGTLATTAILPGGNAGNHFLQLRFSHTLNVDSILSADAANHVNSGLTGAVQILQYDPVTEQTSYVKGRGFIGGYTYYDDPTTSVLDLRLVRAVEADKDGNIVIRDARANGFPAGFSGAGDLVAPNTFTFIPDADGLLTSFETFPANRLIRILALSSVLDYRNKPLMEEVSTSTTVGSDNIAPQVLGYSSLPQIVPGNGQVGVDPMTTIQIVFSKPVQPRDVGEFYTPSNLTPPSRGVGLSVTLAATSVPVSYYADPRSPSDFTTYTVKPAYFLPGDTPVDVSVGNTINSLSGIALGQTVTTSFRIGEGPGLVNAPVSPEVVYVGRVGVNAGLSAIDLNGFGQGTGDIGDTYPSRWPMNPNVGQPGVTPSLAPGKTNMDAGGEGALTLVRDSKLSTLLIDSRIVSGIDDIHIGQPLDKVFNNEGINPNTTRGNQINPITFAAIRAWGNCIGVAPHPNPPRLLFPPPNPANAIFGEEPTTTSSGPPWITPYIGLMTNHPPVGPCMPHPLNRLTTGDPLTSDLNKIGIYGGFIQGFFNGPQPAPTVTPVPPTPYCPYTSRQQIGHFLYALDRVRKQVLVLNSNRMTVMETVKLPDPYSMALSPNLKRLAITNFSSNNVSFIDTDPASERFNTVIATTQVGRGPTACAWQPEGEDLLVLNTTGNSMTILSGGDLGVRKTVTGQISSPIELAVTARQQGFGWQTGIYFAYILNGNGSIVIFESGPDGVNGIGFDSIVGIPEGALFRGARTLHNDVVSLNSAVWVPHVDQGHAVVSHFELTSSTVGPLPIAPSSGGFILPPTFRQREWSVNGRIGGVSATTPVKDRLSGTSPVDLAIDDIYNAGAIPDLTSNQNSNLIYADHSGKGAVRGGGISASAPRFLFVAFGDTGTVDVVEMDTGKRVKTLDVPGVGSLSYYWRQ
jgi:DNA-binding beta-propeller fold protein YncE